MDGGAESAQSSITDMLTKFPKDGDVWACWDVRMVGATQAVDASSRKGIRTYGVDGSPDFVAVAAEPKSPASAVAAQQLYEIGKTAVQNVAKYLAGQKVHLSPSFRTC